MGILEHLSRRRMDGGQCAKGKGWVEAKIQEDGNLSRREKSKSKSKRLEAKVEENEGIRSRSG